MENDNRLPVGDAVPAPGLAPQVAEPPPPEPPAPAPGFPEPAAALRYAGVGPRLLAMLLDILVLYAVSRVLDLAFPLSLPDMGSLGSTFECSPELLTAMLGLLGAVVWRCALNLVVGACYSVLLTGRFGATLGKMALGLRVVREDGSPVTYGTAALREFVVKDLVYGALFLIFWLGYLWAAWDPRKQTWHDKIARTVVIRDGR